MDGAFLPRTYYMLSLHTDETGKKSPTLTCVRVSLSFFVRVINLWDRTERVTNGLIYVKPRLTSIRLALGAIVLKRSLRLSYSTSLATWQGFGFSPDSSGYVRRILIIAR